MMILFILCEYMRLNWLIVLLFINSNHPQRISFYIESWWFEYELCVISDNLLFNISCFHHHSIWYILSTPPIHINTLNYLHSLRDDIVMNSEDKKRDCSECLKHHFCCDQLLPFLFLIHFIVSVYFINLIVSSFHSCFFCDFTNNHTLYLLTNSLFLFLKSYEMKMNPVSSFFSGRTSYYQQHQS